MKKQYMKPAMRVVLLQQKCQILAGSYGANSLGTSPEGFILDGDGLDDDDIQR